MRHVAPALAAALVTLAGCAAPETGAPGGDEGAFALPSSLTGHLHSTMTLTPEPEGSLSVVRTGSFFEAWAAGDDYPTWFADPLGEHALVTSLAVKLFVQTTGPVVESGRFPDIMVYAGAGDAWMGYGERRDLSAFVPGEVYELDVEIGLPPGGLWLGPDVGLGLKVVPVMLQQDDDADVEILLGGSESASRATWALAPHAMPSDVEETADSAEGEVVGTIYAGAAAPPTTSARIPLPLAADTAYVLAWMNTTDNVGVPDIDLSIEAPNGTVLVGSGTPTPREALRLAAANLAGAGDYALVVTTAGSPRATFSLEWVVGRAS